MGTFRVVSPYEPQGDQPQAIEDLANSIKAGNPMSVLLGVTGSGKTYTMAKVIERVQKPTLVLAHNKTLAAQLCSEFKELFPDSAVEFFVSYYDYYQPEAYLPASDTYIEKTIEVNDEIDKLRHSATCALNERNDVIIVASVSCIYGLGDPEEYLKLSVSLREGMEVDRREVMQRLIEIQYQRNDMDFQRGTFRSHGDTLDIYPVNWTDKALRIGFFGDEVERISEINVLTGEVLTRRSHVAIFPASHYATGHEKMQKALREIEADMEVQEKMFLDTNRPLEAERIRSRVLHDIEMMQEIGFCSGIENYSRYFDGRKPGEPPYTLIDYFPKDFLMFIDESHVTLPQVGGMFRGDRARKDALVEYGFRLPSARDNRPLKFEEFMDRVPQIVCVSATPASFELSRAAVVAEQIIRPTGLIDPEVSVRPVKGQIDDLLGEVRIQAQKGFRTLITTLTKRMAEDLTEYLDRMGVRVRYMHSDIDTLDRMEIIRDLRLGEFDALVGINLLREGLDLPEVGLVAILDADKEGFLRSETSLMQTIGRSARNVNAKVLLYADKMTEAMRHAIDETARRRQMQNEFNLAHGITPQTIKKNIDLGIEKEAEAYRRANAAVGRKSEEEIVTQEFIAELEAEMMEAAGKLEFERAAAIRDRIDALKKSVGKPVSEVKPEKRPRGRRRSR